jgi:hypothetical protein
MVAVLARPTPIHSRHRTSPCCLERATQYRFPYNAVDDLAKQRPHKRGEA